MSKFFVKWLFCVLIGILTCYAEESSYGISGNPGAVNVLIGKGELGVLLRIPKNSGFRLGGLWMGDYNALVTGVTAAHDHRRWTGNSLFIFDLSIDLQKTLGWKHAFFGSEFLQFNGQATNADAGVVQGYNSLPGAPPLKRVDHFFSAFPVYLSVREATLLSVPSLNLVK